MGQWRGLTSKFCDLAPFPLPPSWGSTLLVHTRPAGRGPLNGASTTTLSEAQSSRGNGQAKKALHPHFLPSTDLSGSLPLVNRASPLGEPAHISLLFEHPLPQGPWCGPFVLPQIRSEFYSLCSCVWRQTIRSSGDLIVFSRPIDHSFLSPSKMADWRSNSRQLGPLKTASLEPYHP